MAAMLILVALLADDPVDKLHHRYLEIRSKDDYTRARNDILRKLGGHDTPKARAVLLKTLGTTKSRDERVNCVRSLGRIADLGSTRKLIEKVGKRKEPALFEALADALGGIDDGETMLWLATDAFRMKKPGVLYALAKAQQTLAMPEAIPHLTRLYREHGELDVRFAAVLGLSATGGDALAEAGKDKEWRIRLAAARAASLAPGLLEDPSASIRQIAARTCGIGKMESVVPKLIELVESDARMRTRHEAALALESISGKKFELDASRWRRWWKEKNDEIKPGTRSVARYYSFGVYSDRVLFIVDMSGSMNWPFSGRRPKRIEVARQQLAKAIKGLPKRSLFNLMVYSSSVRIWQKKELEASEKNVARALNWAQKRMAEPDGDTHTYDALEKAFAKNPHFDTIYLLSDGNPSHGDYKEPEGVIASVNVWNRYRQARVYTIHLTLANVDRGRPIFAERPQLMRHLMTGLAKATGGRTTLVESPPPG
ncbi:MAG: VWA domain-containing protein [Planctomycetota bacterium]